MTAQDRQSQSPHDSKNAPARSDSYPPASYGSPPELQPKEHPQQLQTPPASHSDSPASAEQPPSPPPAAQDYQSPARHQNSLAPPKSRSHSDCHEAHTPADVTDCSGPLEESRQSAPASLPETQSDTQTPDHHDSDDPPPESHSRHPQAPASGNNCPDRANHRSP